VLIITEPVTVPPVLALRELFALVYAEFACMKAPLAYIAAEFDSVKAVLAVRKQHWLDRYSQSLQG
jgi:hypothetical protein